MSARELQRRLRSLAERLHPGRRRLARSFRGLRTQFYEELWQRTAQRLQGRCVDLGDGYAKIEFAGRHTFVHGGDVMLDSHLLWELAGNKPLCHQLLQNVPRYSAASFQTYDLENLLVAEQFLDRLGRQAVVKPADGPGAGRGITTGIWWDALHPAVPWEDFPEALHLKERVLALPVHQDLDAEQIDRLARAVRDAVRAHA